MTNQQINDPSEFYKAILGAVTDAINDLDRQLSLLPENNLTYKNDNRINHYISQKKNYETLVSSGSAPEQFFKSVHTLCTTAKNLMTLLNQERKNKNEIRTFNPILQKFHKIQTDIDNAPARLVKSGESLPKISPETTIDSLALAYKQETERLQQKIAEFEKNLLKSEQKIKSLNDISNELNAVKNEVLSIEKSIDSVKYETSHLNTELSKKTQNLESLSEKISDINSEIKTKFNEIEKYYNESIDRITTKENDLNSLIGSIADKILAGRFEKNATDQESTANTLRGWAIFLMVIMMGFLVTALIMSLHNGFIWQQSLFGILGSLIFSIPAAYLAKESARHRQQQFHYRQTSLDLRAIDPFLASLSKEDQSHLKAELSRRLFAERTFQASEPKDSYPINTQDLLIALINKLEFPILKQNQASNNSIDRQDSR